MIKSLKKFLWGIFKEKTLDEKTISRLKFRKNGDVSFDPKSRKPRFVDYNNARLQIQLAKNKGQKSVRTVLSTMCLEELVFDGYHVSVGEEDTEGNRHLIEW